jgi:putative hydrolase of the HAD superfamily
MQNPGRTPARRITAVLFDMDNTLWDFVECKIAACDAVNGTLGIDRGRELLYYFLRGDGRSFEDPGHIRDFMTDNGVYSEDLFADCCRVYEDVKAGNLAPFPNVERTLTRLKEKGLHLSIVTDAFMENAIARLEQTGLAGMFDEVITADITRCRKPDPKVFLYALGKMGRAPEEVLMVGDSLHRDIGPAKRLGMTTAYASYGDRNFLEDRTEEPDVVLKDIADLLSVVEGNHRDIPVKRYQNVP